MLNQMRVSQSNRVGPKQGQRGTGLSSGMFFGCWVASSVVTPSGLTDRSTSTFTWAGFWQCWPPANISDRTVCNICRTFIAQFPHLVPMLRSNQDGIFTDSDCRGLIVVSFVLNVPYSVFEDVSHSERCVATNDCKWCSHSPSRQLPVPMADELVRSGLAQTSCGVHTSIVGDSGFA